MTDRIAVQWSTFLVRGLPAGTPDDVRDLMQAAFYRGVVSTVHVILGEVSDAWVEGREGVIDDVLAEVAAFTKAYQRRNAERRER